MFIAVHLDSPLLCIYLTIWAVDEKEKKIQQRENMRKPHRTRAPGLSGLRSTLFCAHATAPLTKIRLIKRL